MAQMVLLFAPTFFLVFLFRSSFFFTFILSHCRLGGVDIDFLFILHLPDFPSTDVLPWRADFVF